MNTTQMLAARVEKLLRDTSCNKDTRISLALEACRNAVPDPSEIEEHVFVKSGDCYVETPEHYGLSDAIRDIRSGQISDVRQVLYIAAGCVRDATTAVAYTLSKDEDLSSSARAFVDWAGFEPAQAAE